MSKCWHYQLTIDCLHNALVAELHFRSEHCFGAVMMTCWYRRKRKWANDHSQCEWLTIQKARAYDHMGEASISQTNIKSPPVGHVAAGPKRFWSFDLLTRPHAKKLSPNAPLVTLRSNSILGGLDCCLSTNHSTFSHIPCGRTESMCWQFTFSECILSIAFTQLYTQHTAFEKNAFALLWARASEANVSERETYATDLVSCERWTCICNFFMNCIACENIAKPVRRDGQWVDGFCVTFFYWCYTPLIVVAIYDLCFFCLLGFLAHSTGQYRIQDLDKVMYTLNNQFGKIAKVGGLIGHPDLLFVFDGDEIRKIFKKEETLPHRCASWNHRRSCGSINTWLIWIFSVFFFNYFSLGRPSMPSLHHYKANLRRDFFGDDAGLIGVYVSEGPHPKHNRMLPHLPLPAQSLESFTVSRVIFRYRNDTERRSLNS